MTFEPCAVIKIESMIQNLTEIPQ